MTLAIDANWFDARVRAATDSLVGNEVLLASLEAETTDFVRLNHAQVRQAGTVDQIEVGLELVEGKRHSSASVQLTGDAQTDDARIAAVLAKLRDQRSQLPEDPHLLINTEPVSSHHVGVDDTPDTDQVVRTVTERGAGQDLVGIYAAGTAAAGFANSLGQRNWFETSTFDFDWTRYLEADKAVKTNYAGFAWDDAAFDRKVADSDAKFEALQRPPIDLSPGEYRTMLSPSAMEELVGLLTWNAFGVRAQRTSQSSFLRLVSGEANLDARVRLSEHTAEGVAPNFQAQGFMRPDEVVLVDGGAIGDALVSPRSAVEYGLATNGASSWESPESLSMAGGSLNADGALAQLGTGLSVGNLWYTNFSDLPGCRVTGMTRFATFWVEDGEIAAPVNVMRFDDTVFNLLGERLIDLTTEPELLVENSSYGNRSMASMTLPGALIDGMRFTL